MAIGIPNFQTLYKTYYPASDLDYMIPENLPLLNMIDRDGELSGDVIDHPFLYGTPQGYSADFTTAQAQAGNAPRSVRASLRVSQAYSMVEFDDKDEALSDGEAAYADLFQKTMTGRIESFLNNLDLDLHVGGTGWRGTVLAVAGQANPYNPTQTIPVGAVAVTAGFGVEATFEQDQQLQAATYTGFPVAGSVYPPADGRTPTTISSPVQVTLVDPNNRLLYLTDASQFTVGSFICQAGGALGFSSANLRGGIIGLDAWNPYGGVVSGENFCGIDRSRYATRMAGYFFDGSRFSMEDALKRLSAKMSVGGSRTSNVALMHPLDMDAMDSKMATFGRYSTFDTATYGFDSIVIKGAAGRIDVVADPHQPQGFARLLDPTAIKLRHKYELPHIVEVGGKNVEQGANFDGRTARLRMYGQLCVMKPMNLGIVKLPQVLV